MEIITLIERGNGQILHLLTASHAFQGVNNVK